MLRAEIGSITASSLDLVDQAQERWKAFNALGV
jgi:hypothetical protein